MKYNGEKLMGKANFVEVVLELWLEREVNREEVELV